MLVLTTGDLQPDRSLSGEPTIATLCQDCQRVVGRLTLKEIGELACSGEPIRCFECDPPDDRRAIIVFAHGLV